jgi:hypothetical protein
MCNACGFLCCFSDEFSECGCEHCPYEACHYSEEDDEIDDWSDDGMNCACLANLARGFRCDSVEAQS